MKAMSLKLLAFVLFVAFNFNLCKASNEVIQEEYRSFDYQCLLCKWSAQMIITYHNENAKPQALFNVLSNLCSFLGRQDKQVCQGMINNVGEHLFAILDEANNTISARDICGMALGGSCAHNSKRLYDWSLNIPDLDAISPMPNPNWPKTSNRTHKILHLSDPHVQLDYTVGSSTDCGKVICCSSQDPPPADINHIAGLYGDYNCDLPLNSLNLLLTHAKSHHDIEYILLTGDYPAHDVWRQDKYHNLQSAKAIVESVSAHFPGTRVFPALGNHEIFPVNMFPSVDPNIAVPKMYDPHWLYNNLADLYQHWLPEKSQQDTLRDSGYYSILVKENLRVISINANFCNNFNFWLLLNFNDPHKHLQWLYRQLHKAEHYGESVFILGHIAPGTHSCLGKWSHEYNRIVKRFNNTIAAQFFGHTHVDEFQVFFNHSEPISVAYLSPSQTTFQKLNPAYRVYTVDEDTNLLLDHETFYLDLAASNKEGQPVISKLYGAKEDLQLDDMSPKSWHHYVQSLARDEAMFEQFMEHYYRKGPMINETCDAKCKNELLCSLLTSQSQLMEEPHVCKDLKTDYQDKWSQWWTQYLWSD